LIKPIHCFHKTELFLAHVMGITLVLKWCLSQDNIGMMLKL